MILKDMMLKIINDLWFKRRDIVSSGYDESLTYLAKIIPLKIHKIPTGTKCWTWTVPEKWIIKEAFIEDLAGKRVLDLKDHPLNVLSYSLPINKIVRQKELKNHIFTNPKRPQAIPFEFKYYQKGWGFCLPYNRLKEFKKKQYRVFVDSRFEKGSLKVGDFTIKGKTNKTIVLVGHLCHPATANDGLSGVAVMVDIAKELIKKNNYFTYKFLFVPEVIGSVAYLSQHESLIPKLRYGIFLEMLGNNRPLALQLSRQGDTKVDKVARYVMQKEFENFREAPFRKIVGNDEIVFNGPGVNVPMISLSRFPYPEYHTSDDNPKIIFKEKLKEAKNLILKILNILDRDYIPKRKFKGPVFLSGYGLWVDWRLDKKLNENIEQMMLNFEGEKSVFEIAVELKMDFDEVINYVNKFLKKGLIKKIKDN